MEIRNASDVPASVTEWFAPERYGERFPKGTLTVVAGPPGVNKSTLLCDLVSYASKQGATMLSNTEDAEGALRLRLEHADADLSNVSFSNPHFPRDLDDFLAWIRQDRPVLIGLDPIAAHFGGLIYQEGEFRAMFRQIRDALEEVGTVLLGIHHTISHVRKSDHALNALGGPVGSLKGTARAAWVFGMNPDGSDERILAHAKDNCGVTKSPLVFDLDYADVTLEDGKVTEVLTVEPMLAKPCSVKAIDVLFAGDGASDPKPDKLSRACEWLTEYLCLGAQKVNDLRADARVDGFGWQMMQRSSQHLGVVKTQVGGGTGSHTTWALPDGHPALVEGDVDIDNLIDEILGDEGEDA